MSDIATLVHRALADRERGLGAMELALDDDALAEIVRFGAAATRAARSARSKSPRSSRRHAGATIDHARRTSREAAQHKALLYDRAGEEHYNVISAFIKSMRGSDPDAALYWMTRMVEAGEDPLFIARRMVIFAAEDIGNADPRALQVAIAVKDAVDFVGLPEGVIPLAQGVTYLAGAPKSNASYRAMLAAREDARKARRAAGAAPSAQRADADDAQARLRRGLSLSARLRRRGRRAELSARPTRRDGSITSPRIAATRARMREYLDGRACERSTRRGRRTHGKKRD